VISFMRSKEAIAAELQKRGVHCCQCDVGTIKISLTELCKFNVVDYNFKCLYKIIKN